VERDQKARSSREWTQLAKPWIKEAREGRNATRAGLLDAAMLKACGEVRGLDVLECGCGEGRFCRMLALRGAATVLGIDFCEPMIDAARAMTVAKDAYRVADAENLRFIEAGFYDLAVSYLNQCDLFDFEANNREVFRVLKPGGRFVVANLHPMRSAVGGWQKDGYGAKQHVILDRYFDEGERRWKMIGVELTNYHRTLSTYVQSYIEAGFAIEGIVEPTVSVENLQRYPELVDERRVPNFILFILQKKLK
jgi:SAM-dependent methyltransferase